MPVSFKCQCGKALKVKDEFAGKKVKCPSCSRVMVTPEITAQDLISADGIGNPEESSLQVKCLTCGAELKEEDPVCMKCGTIRQVAMKTNKGAREKNQVSAEKPFYMKPATWIVVAILIILGFVYNNYSNQTEEAPGANGETIKSDMGADTNTVKEPAPRQNTPEKLFTAELQNKNVANLDKMVEYIIKMREKSAPVLGKMAIDKERAVQLKSLLGLYIMSYFKCYRSQVQTAVRNIPSRVSKDEELSQITMETGYLLATDNPDPVFLKFTDIAAKYTEQFKEMEKSPVSGLARDSIIKPFTQNQSSLVKANAFAYLILLGDRWNIRQIINIAKDSSGEAITFTKAALVEFTGCSFEKQEEWNKWYADNKNFPPARWLINSLEQATEEQRQKTIKKLVRITGKDFSYPENATDEQRKEAINKWKEFGKTLK
ncbi:MAG: zinc ribbon domain-containing protein [Planctomycetes bacterium]|nr:zinc ribbon domain-containing protein [Planctomycetota bacterium]